MKNLIKIAGLIATGAVSAGDSKHLTGQEILHLEINTPAGLSLNKQGQVLNNNTKAMLDHERPVGGTSIRYFSSAGSAMDFTGSYTYVSPGCRQATSGSTSMDESLDIPRDSRIISLSAYGNDSSNSSQETFILYRTDIITGDLSSIASYSSGITQTPNQFNIGGYLDYTKGYEDNLWLRLTATGNDIVVCGFRVGYLPPDVADDIIFVNNFYR